MDRHLITDSGPILVLDWSSTASSTKSRARDDGGVGRCDDGGGMRGISMAGAGVGWVGGGAGLRSGGWIVSTGLDRTVKVCSHMLPFYSQHVS